MCVGWVRAAGVEPAARLWAAAARPECAAAASGARGETSSLHEEVGAVSGLGSWGAVCMRVGGGCADAVRGL